MKRLITILLAAGLFAHTAHAQNWKTYTDENVGYSITYPAFLNEVPWRILHPGADPSSPQQWRTRTFRSRDREVSLDVETHSVAEPKSLEQFFKEKIANRTSGGDHIGNVLTKENWYVISGDNAQGYEFYEKFYLFTTMTGEDGGWYIYFDFVYPHVQHKIYDPLVTKIARDFIPNLPGIHDH